MKKGDIVYPLVQQEGRCDFSHLVSAKVMSTHSDLLIEAVEGKMYFQDRFASSLYVDSNNFTTIKPTTPLYEESYSVF